ncbi:MAG: metal ABC transporter permease [Phycisphaerae bacterium]
MISPVGILAQAGLLERFLHNPLYQQSLAGGLGIAVLCGLLSVFVVLKRMSFIGQGISHAAFGGVGVAVLVEAMLSAYWPTLAAALGVNDSSSMLRDGIIALFCVAAAVLIGYLSRRGPVAEDTAIGICLVAAMALGVILLDIRSRYGTPPATFESILFGSIFFITPSDVWLAWILALLVCLAVVSLFKELVFFAFDEETAGAFGVRTGLLYYGLLVALGLSIVVALKSLGVILASALLILPGATARFWSNRIGVVTALSVIISAVGLAVGLALAVYLGTPPPGAVIVLTLTAFFVLSYVLYLIRRAAARP